MTSRSCEGLPRPWSMIPFQTRNPIRSENAATSRSAIRHRVRQPNQMAVAGTGANKTMDANRATSSERAKDRISQPHPQIAKRVARMVRIGRAERFSEELVEGFRSGWSTRVAGPSTGGSTGPRPEKFGGSNDVSSALQAARSENPSRHHRMGTT